MKLYLDTSGDDVILRLDETEYRWTAGRKMADGLLPFIEEKLAENGAKLQDIKEITFFPGPGSFTGLRIGATLVNTIGFGLGISIHTPDGKAHEQIVPEYGRPANLTVRGGRLIKENVPLSTLTTMRLGGAARYVFSVHNSSEVAAAYDFAREKKLPTLVMGGGSNLIGHDEGFDGVVILNEITGIRQDGDLLIGGAGEVLDDFIAESVRLGFADMALLSGIPGTLGGAMVQNSGAYGAEMVDVVEWVEVFEIATGKVLRLSKDELKLSYRRSVFNTEKRGEYYIIQVAVRERAEKLKPPFYLPLQRWFEEHGITDYTAEKAREGVLDIRNSKLPDPKMEASAGSFFKNIVVDKAEADRLVGMGLEAFPDKDEPSKFVVNSGALIEAAGLKGKELHGFQVSPKAALILINRSATSYADLMKAREEIRNQVFEKFGVRLEQEPEEIVNG